MTEQIFDEFLLDCAAYWTRQADHFRADAERHTDRESVARCEGAAEAFESMAYTFRKHVKAERTPA